MTPKRAHISPSAQRLPSARLWLQLTTATLFSLALLGGAAPALAQIASNFEGSASQIAVGREHACMVTSSAAAQCWGNKGSGRVGDGNFNGTAMTPVNTGLSSGVIAVAAGFSHSCALTSTGAVSCWGQGNVGQLGNNAITT